jgi:hypothetical protein
MRMLQQKQGPASSAGPSVLVKRALVNVELLRM